MMPDNYSLFLCRQEREQRWLRSRPRCSYCGEPIQDEILWAVEGEVYHPDCAEALFCFDTERFVQ